jgi:hypothetical protein
VAAQDFDTSKEVAEYDKAIAEQVKLRDSYALTVKANEEAKKSAEAPKEKTDQEKITEAREAAVKKYEEVVRSANDKAAAGLIDQQKLHEELHQALETEYSDLEAIAAQYKLNAGATINLRDEVSKMVLAGREELKTLEEKKTRQKEIGDILKGQRETFEEQGIENQYRLGIIKTEVDYNIKLIELERARERAALEANLTRIKADDKERETALANFDRLTEGMIEAKKSAAKADSELAKFFQSDGWNRGMQMATAAVQTFSDIANAITQAQNDAVTEQVEDIDKMLDKKLERIEEMREKALEEAGFAEATTQESLQAKLDAAIETGDQILAYEYQRRLEEKAINDRFDAQTKAAEEKAAKEKAQLEYKAAKTEWAMSLIQAGNNMAMAILNAIAQGSQWPLPMGGPPVGIPFFTGLTAAVGTVQLALIAANPPKPPSFESGGIVPGSSFSGDNVLTSVNSGERILTMDNQEFLLAAAGGGGQTVTVIVPVYLDGQKIAEVVADEINSARVMLDERGIRRR